MSPTSMEHTITWEANSYLASQKILLNLWNREVHYSAHNSIPQDPCLNKIIVAYTSHLIFVKICFNLVFL